MSKPELLKFALDRRIKSLGIARKVDGGKIMARWPQLVGPQLARRSTPASFHEGRLTVVVPDAAWRHQLSLARIELVKQLNEAVGRNVVKDIYIVASSRNRPHA